MELRIDLNDFNANFTIFSLGSITAEKLEEKVTETKLDEDTASKVKTGEIRVAKNGDKFAPKLIRGKKTYNATDLKIIAKTDDGESELKNCSVRLMNPADLELGARYRAEGVVLYKSWSSQNSFGVNHQFHIEKLVKVGAENNPKQG